MKHATELQAPSCDCCGTSSWEYAFSESNLDLGRCTVCGLHYLAQETSREQRMTELEVGHFAGEQEVSNAAVQRRSEEIRAREFERYVDIAQQFAPPGKWMDVGCGAGTLLSAVQRRGIEVEGIELTADRRALAQRLTGATIHGQPLELLPLPPGSLAAILMINVFSHLTSPTETLRHMREVLAPGGIVLVHTGQLGPGIRKRHAFSWSLGDHLYWLGDGTIDRYAAKLGYEVAYRDVVWQPATVYTAERFKMPGRSKARNAVKTAIVRVPGALPLLRWYMLNRRERENPYHVLTCVLRKTESGGGAVALA